MHNHDAKGKIGGATNAREQDPQPLAGYAALLTTYGIGAMAACLLLFEQRKSVRRINLRKLALMAIATEHLSRTIAKDSITSPLRAPFARFVEPIGDGEVNEEVIGTGLRRAIGELITCPFCLAQWVATALVAGSLAVPNFTAAVTTVSTLARASDYLQFVYDRAKNND
jgi:hypothetical protein